MISLFAEYLHSWKSCYDFYKSGNPVLLIHTSLHQVNLGESVTFFFFLFYQGSILLSILLLDLFLLDNYVLSVFPQVWLLFSYSLKIVNTNSL